MGLTTLFVDMNAYFASVEQQDRKELRGRPVVVAAVDADSTCCIAASYEAKRLGVRTGTPVWQARRIPAVRVVVARPAKYVEVHHQIVAAVESCLPIHGVHSIDEMSCRLGPRDCELDAALDVAGRVKAAIRGRVGEFLRCSIGLGPNRLLAKVATDLQKPDGLVVVTAADLPDILHPLRLNDLPGIGPRMLVRLNRAGVESVAQLCRLDEGQMRDVWGGVVGRRWWHWLRGHDLPEPPTHRATVGHSHVLPPALRNDAGAEGVLVRMIHKAAARLRRMNYWARQMSVYVSFTFREEGWSGSVALGLCQDTQTMLEAFQSLWRHRPRLGPPTQVAVTLYNLVSGPSAAIPLFPAERRRVELSRVMDQLNKRFGPDTVYFAGMHTARDAAPTRIAFGQIPAMRDGKWFIDP